MTRRRVIVLTLGCGLASIATMLAAAKFAMNAIQGAPYEMTLRRSHGRAVVQFARPDRRLVSPEFPINLPIEESRVAILRSDDVAIPNCVVEFYDTTILPGRFKIRIGDTLFDVMERGIIVGDKEYDWQP